MKIWKHTFTITKGDLRDFRIMLVAIILNISFAAEKLFIVIWHQLPDVVWLFVYWWLWLFLAYLAIVDFVHDEIEEEKHETNNLL